jgi:RNA polymerase sigma-70 factor (ECF subfamily)
LTQKVGQRRLSNVSSTLTMDFSPEPALPTTRAPRTVRPMHDARDDSELLLAYAGGDAGAFDVLYGRHRGPLYRYLVRQCHDRELANDLFQEVWGKVIAQRARYERRAKFQTFLYTIAYHCFIDHCRRRSVRPQLADEDDAELTVPAPENDGPDRGAEQQELGAQLRSAIARLPDEQRDAFLLYEESGLSVEQIAAVTGVGAETAKSRLRYAVAKLRSAMAEMEPDR